MNKQIIPNDAIMKYYFYFIEERMNMFWRKIEGGWNDGWSKDQYLKHINLPMYIELQIG